MTEGMIEECDSGLTTTLKAVVMIMIVEFYAIILNLHICITYLLNKALSSS